MVPECTGSRTVRVLFTSTSSGTGGTHTEPKMLGPGTGGTAVTVVPVSPPPGNNTVGNSVGHEMVVSSASGTASSRAEPPATLGIPTVVTVGGARTPSVSPGGTASLRERDYTTWDG